jgi:hypothetical protein
MSSLPPAYDSATATRTRVKWDNIAIVLIGAVVAAFAVVAIIATSDSAPTKQATRPAPIRDEQLTDAAATGEATDGELTLDDATSLADEAKTFISQARWDEAADRLQTIPSEFRAAVDADAIEARLTELRTQHDQLKDELTAAVEARQWKQADVLLDKLAKIAPLDSELLATQAQVDAALAPAATSAKDGATASTTRKPAKGTSTATTNATSTSGGGGANSTTTHHSTATARPNGSSTSRPAGSTARPGNTSNTSGGGGSSNATPTPAPTSSQIDALLDGSQEMTQEELEAILANYGVDSLDELAAL